MANFTHLLSGFTQRGFPFVLKLFKWNLQQLLFLLLKSINALNCHVLFFALLHHCLDVAVTSVLLDYVVFKHFHRHWLFMVLRTAEVSWNSTEYNQLTNNVNKLWTITNICGCILTALRQRQQQDQDRQTQHELYHRHTYTASLQECQTGSAADGAAAAAVAV